MKRIVLGIKKVGGEISYKKVKVRDYWGWDVTAWYVMCEGVVVGKIFPYRVIDPKKKYNTFSEGEGRAIDRNYYLKIPAPESWGRNWRTFAFESLRNVKNWIEEHFDKENWEWVDLPTRDD